VKVEPTIIPIDVFSEGGIEIPYAQITLEEECIIQKSESKMKEF